MKLTRPTAPRPRRAERIQAMNELEFIHFENRKTAATWQHVAKKLGIICRVEKALDGGFRLWRMRK